LNKPTLYFERDVEWYDWLLTNHNRYRGVYLIFYKKEIDIPSMTWAEAVKVALCFGWIDSTVKSLGDGKRQQYFSPRNPKSAWSKLNKTYIDELHSKNLIQESGFNSIQIAKENGAWFDLDNVENLIVPDDLQHQFNQNSLAFENYKNFAPTYKKGYLYWLHSAKRETTRIKRIKEIILLCQANKKNRY
jgi:uncharacterized protein YdeI (YjbR/CyaY-like superfamily)